MSKVTVITDKSGKIVGTQQGYSKDSPAKKGLPRVSLTPGPNQTLNEVEMDLPRLGHTEKDLTEYNEAIQKHLSARKR